LLSDRRVAGLVYGLPAAAIIVSGALPLTDGWRAAVWTISCAVMGAACLVNAAHCGRIHCFFTGPFFLAVATAATLYGAGVFPLGPRGWNLLGLTLFAGTFMLMVVPELVFGKYRRGPDQRLK
jgi:hypothetical protein